MILIKIKIYIYVIFWCFLELKEAFDLFDFDKDKKIAIEEVGLVIRSSGLDPTTESLDRILSEIKRT